MAGEEEILFNVNGNVSDAVTALNEWISAIQNVQRSFGELGTAISELTGSFDGLSQSIDGVMTSLNDLASSPAAEMLNTLVEASTALEEAGAGVAQTIGDEASVLQSLADSATMASDALASATPSAEELDTVLSTMTDGIGTVVTELSNMGPAGDEAMQAMIDLAQAVGDAEGILSTFAGDSEAVAVAVDTLGPSFQAARDAVYGLGEAGGPAVAAFSNMATQLDQISAAIDPTSAALAQLSTMALDTASSVDAAAQTVAGSAGSIDASGASIAAAGGDVEALSQAFMNVSPAAGAAQVAAAQAAQQVSQVQTAMQQAAQGTTGFEDALNALLAKLDEVVAAVDSLTVAEETNAAEDNVAREGMGGDAYMLMMLIPMITQVAGGFLQMGTSAEDAIAHITGLADQTLALSSNSKTLNADIGALEVSSQKYGVSMTDAANGLYYIISAGFSTADALKVLNVSMETSAATGTKMTDVSNALTSVLHAYNLTADQTKTTQDKLTAAVVGGKQSYDEFAKVIGRTAAVGSSAGVSLKELLAAESELTQINPSVRQDTQNLANLMNVLGTGADKTAKSAAGLGLKFDETKYRSMDLYEKLQYLEQVTGGNNDKMRALLQNSTAYTAALNLMRDGGTLFANQMINQGNAIGSTDRAFQQASQTITFALSRISAALSVMSYEVVRAVGPVVAPLFDKFASLLGNIASNANILMPIVAGLAALLGVILVGALNAVIGMFWGMLVPIGAIGLAIAVLVGFVVALIPQFQAMYQSASPVGAMLRDMVATVKSTAMTLRDALGGALTALHPLFQGLGTILQSVVVPALAYLAGGIGQGVAQIFNMLSSAVRAATPSILQFGLYIQQNVAPALQKALPDIEKFASFIGRMIPVILAVGGPLLALRGAVGLLSGGFQILEPAIGIAGAAFNAFKIPAAGIDFIMNALKFSILHPVQSLNQITLVIKNVSSVIAGQFKFAWIWLQDAFETVGVFITAAGGPLQAFWAICQGAGAAVGGFAMDLIAMINPVTVIAAVLVALTAILIHWLVTTKQGQAVLAGLWDALVKVGQVILSSLQPAWASLQASMRLIMASLMQVWVALQPLMPLFLHLAQILGGILVVSIAIAIAAIVGIITALANFIAGLVNVIAHVIQFVTGVIQLFAGLFTMLKGLIHGNTAEISQGWSTFCQGLQNMWNGLWGAIVGIAKTFINTIKGLVGGFASAISGMFHAMADAVVHHSIWPDMWTAIGANTSQNTTKVHAQVQTFSTNTQATFLQMQVQSVQSISAMWQRVQTTITTSMTASANAVRTGMTLITAVIAASGNQIVAAITKAFADVLKAIETPLADAEKYVQTCFTTMQATIIKSLQLIVAANNTAWTQVNRDLMVNISVGVANITNAYKLMAQTIQTSLNLIEKDNNDAWLRILQSAKTNWTLIEQVFIDAWALLTLDLKAFNTQWFTLDTAQWLLITNMVKTNQTAITLLWTNFWKALILQDQTNWKLMQTDAVTGMNNINVAIQAGVKKIETTITALITWITQQMVALDKNATTWGADFAKNFAAGITSQIGAIRAAATAAAAAAKAPLGHSKPSEGPMSDDDMWGVHFMQNFASGMQLGLPLVQQAAQNAASIIKSSMPTAQNALNASSSSQSGVTNGSEHLQVLKQILAQLRTMQNGEGGSTVNLGSTQIGYSIPSTQLGTVLQQFSNQPSRLSPNEIANIYQQINTLQGLSQEYGARGATTGVGF